MANTLQFEEKKLKFKQVNKRCWLVYASSISKHRVKKAAHAFERKILLPIFSNGSKHLNKIYVLRKKFLDVLTVCSSLTFTEQGSVSNIIS